MSKMCSRAKRRRLIELRGQGVSYAKIAAEIGSSKTTVIRWSRELHIEIKNAVNLEFEGLKEEYLITRDHQIKVLATQLNNVAQELVNRDLSKVPPHRLMEMQTHLRKEMQEKCPEMEFFREIPFGGNADIRKIMVKTDAWEA